MPFRLAAGLPIADYPARNEPAVPLSVAAELALACAQAALDEQGPTPRRKSPGRAEGERTELERVVRGWLVELLGGWARHLHGSRRVIFFEYLRRRAYEFYDQEFAYSTLTCFVAAILEVLQTPSAAGTARTEAPLLRPVAGLLDVLLIDVALFQAVNRGTTGRIPTDVERAIVALSRLAHHLQEGSAAEERWSVELRFRLSREVEDLREVYEGLRDAADALVRYEESDLLSPGAESDGTALGLGSDQHSPQKSVAMTLEHLAEAGARVKRRIEALLDQPAVPGLVSYVSRLQPWAEVLAALAESLRRESVESFLGEVRLTYCFPFAVASDFPFAEPSARAEVDRGLRRLADSGAWRHEQEASLDESRRALLHRVDEFLGSADCPPDLRPMPLSGLWQNTGEGRYGGIRIDLPDLRDLGGSGDGPGDRWRVWADLSRLGNHCLCLEQVISRPSPSAVYRALRMPGYYAQGQDFRYALAPSDDSAAADRGKRWRSLVDFAGDAIGALIPEQTAPDRPTGERRVGPDSVRGQCHVVGMVTTIAPLGERPQDVADTLAQRHGGRLFRVNGNRIASSSAEWLRYQVLDNNIAPLEFGYREDWTATLDHATFFGVTGNPSWQTEAYGEVARFAASWEPLLQMLDRWLMSMLDRTTTRASAAENRTTRRAPATEKEPESHYLRSLEAGLRRHLLIVESDDLCWSHMHRRFIDTSLAAAGVTSRLRQLEQQLDAVELLVREQEREAREASGEQRNRVLATLAILGVLSVTSAFAVLDRASRPYRGTPVVAVEMLILAALIVLVGGWVLWAIKVIEWNPFRELHHWIRDRFRKESGGERPPR